METRFSSSRPVFEAPERPLNKQIIAFSPNRALFRIGGHFNFPLEVAGSKNSRKRAIKTGFLKIER
jgi:hypothetical protein